MLSCPSWKPWSCQDRREGVVQRTRVKRRGTGPLARRERQRWATGRAGEQARRDRSEEEVGVVQKPLIFALVDHGADEVVDTHQRAPTVLEHTCDHLGGLVRKPAVLRDSPVFSCARQLGAVPRRVIARLRVGPPGLPGIDVPRSGDVGRVRRLGRDVGEERLLWQFPPHLADPPDRRVADDGR